MRNRARTERQGHALGTHPGELCSRDRATIFEDPSGLRILYDAGQSVQGADDPRLGTIHVVLVSHAHGDHIGDMKLKAQGAGSCENPELVSAAPASTSGEIAAAKNAALVMVGADGEFRREESRDDQQEGDARVPPDRAT